MHKFLHFPKAACTNPHISDRLFVQGRAGFVFGISPFLVCCTHSAKYSVTRFFVIRTHPSKNSIRGLCADLFLPKTIILNLEMMNEDNEDAAQNLTNSGKPSRKRKMAIPDVEPIAAVAACARHIGDLPSPTAPRNKKMRLSASSASKSKAGKQMVPSPSQTSPEDSKNNS